MVGFWRKNKKTDNNQEQKTPKKTKEHPNKESPLYNRSDFAPKGMGHR